jgi:hypothetical protein
MSMLPVVYLCTCDGHQLNHSTRTSISMHATKQVFASMHLLNGKYIRNDVRAINFPLGDWHKGSSPASSNVRCVNETFWLTWNHQGSNVGSILVAN